MKHCMYCGSEMSDETGFCENRGKGYKMVLDNKVTKKPLIIGCSIGAVIFIGLGILLLAFMFLSPRKAGDNTVNKYNPGVYSSNVTLGDSILNLELVVDANQIKSISFINLDDSITTMYPLLKPSLEAIERELVKGIKLDDIPISEKRKYTETLIIEGIRTALNKALVNSEKNK